MMKEKACVLVCVTQQSSCERLIEAGASIAESRGMDLGVINVQPEKNGFTPDPAAIEHLYNVSRKFGADMSYYFSDSPAAVVAAHGVKNNAEIIVTGFPGEKSSHFVPKIKMLLPDTVISMVDGDKKIYNIIPNKESHLMGLKV